MERTYFGLNFARARQDAGLSQRDVRDKTGLTQGWVSSIELGRANITIDTMAVLARLVGVDVTELLRKPRAGANKPPPKVK